MEEVLFGKEPVTLVFGLQREGGKETPGTVLGLGIQFHAPKGVTSTKWFNWCICFTSPGQMRNSSRRFGLARLFQREALGTILSSRELAAPFDVWQLATWSVSRMVQGLKIEDSVRYQIFAMPMPMGASQIQGCDQLVKRRLSTARYLGFPDAKRLALS